MLLKTKLVAAAVTGSLLAGIAIGSLLVPFNEGTLPTNLGTIEGQIAKTKKALENAGIVIQHLENELAPSADSSKNDNIEQQSQNGASTEKIKNEISNMPNKYKGLYEYEVGQVKKANSDVATWSSKIEADNNGLKSSTSSLESIMETANNTYHLNISDLSSNQS